MECERHIRVNEETRERVETLLERAAAVPRQMSHTTGGFAARVWSLARHSHSPHHMPDTDPIHGHAGNTRARVTCGELRTRPHSAVSRPLTARAACGSPDRACARLPSARLRWLPLASAPELPRARARPSHPARALAHGPRRSAASATSRSLSAQRGGEREQRGDERDEVRPRLEGDEDGFAHFYRFVSERLPDRLV